MEESMVRITPTLIFRVSSGRIELVDVLVDEEVALLVFADPEQAEAFRRETGCYPGSEGFKVRAVDPEGLRSITEAASFGHVALRGPEADTLRLFDAGTFGEILGEDLDEALREAGAPGAPAAAVAAH